MEYAVELSFEESFMLFFGISPEIAESDMNWRPRVSVDCCSVLAPAGPDLLAFKVHYDDLSITSLMISSNILVKSLGCDLAMSTLENVGETKIVSGLNTLVKEKDSVHLRMRGCVLSVIPSSSIIFVIIVVEHV